MDQAGLILIGIAVLCLAGIGGVLSAELYPGASLNPPLVRRLKPVRDGKGKQA